jgi:hypothetical protein
MIAPISLLMALALGAPPAPYAYQEQGFVQVEGHLSLLSDAADRSSLNTTFGYAFRGGYRFGEWGVFASVEHNMWLTSEDEITIQNGALNVGAGFEYLYFEGRARTSLTIGPSVQLFDTVLEKAGEVGFFVDFRPIGIRWKLSQHVVLQLDPLSFALVAPIIGSIPLILSEYRTVLTLEGLF